jgi:hypothetical protein
MLASYGEWYTPQGTAIRPPAPEAPLPSVSELRGTTLNTGMNESIATALANSGWGNVDRGHGLTDYNPNIPADPQFGNVTRSFGGPIQGTGVAGSGDPYADAAFRMGPSTQTQVPADTQAPASTGSWLDILEDMRLNDPAGYADIQSQYDALTADPFTQVDPLQESPSQWGPNQQMPEFDSPEWDAMEKWTPEAAPAAPAPEADGDGGDGDGGPTPPELCIAGGGTWGPNGCTYPSPDVPPDFYQPIDLGAQIRSILGEPSTPDYTDDIRNLYAELEKSVRDRSAERTRVLDESVIRREGQLADIAEALTATLGPLEAARLLQQAGITSDVITRGEGLSAAALTRQEKTRGELGPQVTDEYEQVAELVSGLTGSQATSSADLMSRLESIANMAAGEREAMPGMLEADSLAALGDEEFRIANQIATDLANELGELDPQKAAALLQEKMRRGDFQTEEDMRIATALLGDLQRRTTGVESAWEQARLEKRQDKLLKDQITREDKLLKDQTEAETAAAQATALDAATVENQLREMGIADQFIMPAQQAAGTANWFDPNRDDLLSTYLDTQQETTIGGPTPISQWQRYQIEAAVHAIWDMQEAASGTYFGAIEDAGLMGGQDNVDFDRGEDYSIK